MFFLFLNLKSNNVCQPKFYFRIKQFNLKLKLVSDIHHQDT